MPDRIRIMLFRDGRFQAVRIPVEFELPGDEAVMHRDGDRLVIEPVRKRSLIALLARMKPLDETPTAKPQQRQRAPSPQSKSDISDFDQI
jgi:antitoxin VapB